MNNDLEISLLESEAKEFSRYLSVPRPSNEIIDLYIKGCEKLHFSCSDNKDVLVLKAIKNPWLIPYLDAALAFSKKDSILRKKILLMFSILETSQEYHKNFETTDRYRIYWVNIFFIGIKSVLKLIIGKIIMLFLKRD